ncbi:L-fuculose phosphate aldolase [Granulibacter bethesdensis CGDNIH1]|uniref:L-fuculose phosphate aldolase n=2 Tax=Granulibacter bethesdensis TaxID=364410 RepID=Q0BQ47_GRABC|nr:L-fuculose phosphate aldolase [Granulibacter bethesdensis CGDNIH1]AHJ65359.1 L-fuculose phosphate aldolase [Granulibacter bethesdensis CGDNIH4]APH52928.1 L-fuculose phosphate aldolase [Granulibacter bethesdensis]APH65616.1 L-fuculose phosphate aldolase [Granulibacter bethesdensis]
MAGACGMDEESSARRALVEACRTMTSLGINQGTAGNISLRWGNRMLISPSAIPYDEMTPDMVASMPLDDDSGGWEGPCKPSTEWRFHHGILCSRPEVGAVLHAHPVFCTALAMARRSIPPCHYMITCFGGDDIRCAPYATFGTAELADLALSALEGRKACLLANHGMVVCGTDLRQALWLGVELETLARQYWHSLQIGGPVLLSPRELAETRARFQGYGLQEKQKP